MGVSEIEGCLSDLSGVLIREPYYLGTIFGPPVLGNPHIESFLRNGKAAGVYPVLLWGEKQDMKAPRLLSDNV